MFAIEITSKYVNFVQYLGGGARIQVKDSFSAKLPDRAIKNGQIKDPSLVAEVIRDALLDRNIRQTTAVLVISSMSIKMKDIVIPKESRTRIMELMVKDFGEIISQEDHVIDYYVYGTSIRNKATWSHCTMYACPTELLKGYLAAFSEAKIKIIRIDLHTNAMAKLWEKQDPRIKKTIISDKNKMGNKNPAIASSDRMNQHLQIWVGLFYDEIKILTNALDGNFFSKSIMLAGVEDIATEEDLSSTPENEKQLLLQYMNEIRNFVGFQKNIQPKYKIEDIYLYGDYNNLDKFGPLLEKTIGISVKIMPIPKQIVGLHGKRGVKYICSMGAALRR